MMSKRSTLAIRIGVFIYRKHRTSSSSEVSCVVYLFERDKNYK